MTHEPSTDLTAILGKDGTFSPSWLNGKAVTPVPAGSQADAALTHRITAGGRALGVANVLCADLTGGPGAPAIRAFQLPFDPGGSSVRPPSLLWTPDRQGAVLLPEAGYALLAGSPAFMAAAVAEGVDMARERFRRYARTVAERYPSLPAVVAAYPPAHRTWSHPSDVDPESAAACQLSLLDEFTRGTRNASDFAHCWWKARRASQANGERIQGPLEGLFDRVFMLLEDYSLDPDLAEPGDLSDTELLAAVSEAWNAFDGGEHP